MNATDKSFQLTDVIDDAPFNATAQKYPMGIAFLEEPSSEAGLKTVKADGLQFAKWLRLNHQNLQVAVEDSPRLILHSADIWIPLAFLASDVAFPVYLNLIASYLYDRMKGCLKGESPRVHFSAEFQDNHSGKIKRFTFEGDHESLKSAIKRFDANEFFRE